MYSVHRDVLDWSKVTSHGGFWSPFLDKVLGLAVFSAIHGSCFSVQLRFLSGPPFASLGVGIFPSTCAWLVFRTLQPRMAHDMHSLSAFSCFVFRSSFLSFRSSLARDRRSFCWFSFCVHGALAPIAACGRFASRQFLRVEIPFASLWTRDLSLSMSGVNIMPSTRLHLFS